MKTVIASGPYRLVLKRDEAPEKGIAENVRLSLSLVVDRESRFGPSELQEASEKACDSGYARFLQKALGFELDPSCCANRDYEGEILDFKKGIDLNSTVELTWYRFGGEDAFHGVDEAQLEAIEELLATYPPIGDLHHPEIKY